MVMDLQRLRRLEECAAADLLEIFSSIQGEGTHAGEMHLFVRTSHCDLHCAYCDTPLCHIPVGEASIETAPLSRTFEKRSNPVPLEELAAVVDRALAALPHRAVSFTGGEPLLHPWVVARLAQVARGRGVKTLLETDGNLPEALIRVRQDVDIVSMDWKLASATGEPDLRETHQRFLEAAGGLELYVKAVFVAETPEHEIEEAAAAVARRDRKIPFILQPCTPMRQVRSAPGPRKALELFKVATRFLDDVRVLPQIHRFLAQP